MCMMFVCAPVSRRAQTETELSIVTGTRKLKLGLVCCACASLTCRSVMTCGQSVKGVGECVRK